MGELALIKNGTSENLLNTQLQIGEIKFDLEEAKANVKAFLEKYDGLIIGEDQVKIMKSEIADLRKQATAIDGDRKKFQAKFEEPSKKYKSDVDEIIAEINKAVTYLNSQIKQFDEKVKEDRKQLALSIMETVKIEKALPDDFHFIMENAFLNASSNKTNVKKALVKQADDYLENKKIEEERTKLLLEKKQIVEDMVLEANQNNNLITPIKYTQIESKIEALSILEIKNFIQTLVTAALKPTEESVKEEIEKVIEQPKIQPSPVIEPKIEVKRVTKTKYFEVQVTCEEYKALIDYLKEKNIEFKITDGNIKLVEANSNELEDIEG